MKIMKLLAFLLFIVAQNQQVFALKGPFSDIIAKVFVVESYRNHYSYKGEWQNTNAKTSKENLKHLSNVYKKHIEAIDIERMKLEKPISTQEEGNLIYKIGRLMTQQTWVSRAMFAQNIVNASKKVTKSNWFTHSFNGF